MAGPDFGKVPESKITKKNKKKLHPKKKPSITITPK
jgi:hypothetical protein